MIQRAIRDESGMTMGLTVIMVVLIGVMGAGLLTFVRSDLQSVIETNQGQNAMDIADAGVQAAKSHLRVDSFREHYDTNSSNDCASGPRFGSDNWSKATQTLTPTNCVGSTTVTNNPADVSTTPWPENYGVTRLFGGGRFHVTIECFVQDASAGCNVNPTGTIPSEISSAQASEKKYFKITSTGYSNTTGDRAIRRVEAIYVTSKRTYAPIAFWSPRDINFDGTSCTKKMSFFSGRNITGVTAGSGCGPTNPFGTGKFIAHRPPTTEPPLPPPDAVYGDWKNEYNPTRRTDASGNPITKVGFGALGRVCGGACPDPTSATSMDGSVADGYNDYDRTTGTDSTRANNASLRRQYKFVSSIPSGTTPPDKITFPFNAGNGLSNPRSLVEADLLQEMKDVACDNGNYYKTGPAVGCAKSTTATHNIDSWPAPGSTYFVDGADVNFRVNSSPKASGVLIVRDGNFSFNNSSNGFQGVIIVIGNGNLTAAGACSDSAGKGYYFQPGGVNLDGYVAASGCIDIRGNVGPATTLDYTNLNSFFDVKLWSWRELYQ